MQSTREFKKPYGMALEVGHRAEHRCKSSRAPAGAFPRPPPEPGWAGKRAEIVADKAPIDLLRADRAPIDLFRGRSGPY